MTPIPGRSPTIVQPTKKSKALPADDKVDSDFPLPGDCSCGGHCIDKLYAELLWWPTEEEQEAEELFLVALL
jgi:hypothetical protein